MTEQQYKIIFDVHFVKMVSVCYSLLKEYGISDFDPQDFVQDIFVMAWVKKDRFDEERAATYYMYRALKNKVIDLARRRECERVVRKDIIVLSDTSYELVKIEACLFNIYEAKKKLTGNQKKVFDLCWQGATTEHIADKLKITRHNVWNTKALAISKLRKFYKNSLKPVQ